MEFHIIPLSLVHVHSEYSGYIHRVTILIQNKFIGCTSTERIRLGLGLSKDDTFISGHISRIAWINKLSSILCFHGGLLPYFPLRCLVLTIRWNDITLFLQIPKQLWVLNWTGPVSLTLLFLKSNSLAIRARFLPPARWKLRLCNLRAGYFGNLTCDWLRIVWAYSKRETENGPWSQQIITHVTTVAV